jgi:hypothetical protein
VSPGCGPPFLRGLLVHHGCSGHFTGKSHSTIFKTRPEESVKNRLMAVKRVGMPKGTLKAIIRRSAN